MKAEPLSNGELKVVFECLKASSEGPFFPDWEFHTLFGLERNEVGEIASACPDVDLEDEAVQLAINNSMANLLSYPHHCEEAWPTYISVSRDDVSRIFKKWRNSRKRKWFKW